MLVGCVRPLGVSDAHSLRACFTKHHQSRSVMTIRASHPHSLPALHREPSVSERLQDQKAFSARGAKSECGSATTLAIICRSSVTIVLYWHGSSVMSLIHVSFTVLQSFSTTCTCGPLVGNAMRKKTMYLTFVVCRCPIASWLGSGNMRKHG